MKIKLPFLILSYSILFISNMVIAQKGLSRFEKLKGWKLGYLIENTSMNLEELEIFKCIFEEYENTYHSKIWSKVHRMRKEFKNSLDTISSSLATEFISEIDDLESKGMKMKHHRNERFLMKIRPKIVLSILYQEKQFDRELFNKIRRKPKGTKEK